MAFESLLCTFQQQTSPTYISSKPSCTAHLTTHSSSLASASSSIPTPNVTTTHSYLPTNPPSFPLPSTAASVSTLPISPVSKSTHSQSASDLSSPSNLQTISPPLSKSYAAVVSSNNSNPAHLSGKIIKFRGAHDPLSNFYPFDLEINGVIWASVEHRYQYDKAIFFDQLELAEEIRNAPSALHAKKLSKMLPKTDSWDRNKLSVVNDLLILKAEQCQPFRTKLLRSGNNKLSHPVSDMFWGAGKDGKGEEHMAKLLYKIRNQIRNNVLPGPQTPIRSKSFPSCLASSFPSPDKEVAFKIIPNRHQNTTTKNKLWCLPEIREKILIIGDSNLTKITQSPLPNIQIESYPGAKFNHIQTILDRAKNFKSCKIPEHVILSVGINNRNQNIYNTAIPNLKTLLAKAQRVFPNSKLHIAQINHSQKMSREECCQLSIINDYLVKVSGNVAVLPKISTQAVKTVSGDPVHYTDKTANAILCHWMQHLN